MKDDSDGASGRFWPADSGIEPAADPMRLDSEPKATRALSLATERWLALAMVVAMIALSDLMMWRYWH